MNEYTVSVIVVTYNSDWEKIRLTLLSIIKQIDISVQIIIADDGSQKVFDDKIAQLMELYTFTDYEIVNSKVNHGTVLNIDNALERVRGSYTKTIAPGDYLFDCLSLSKWIEFMVNNNFKVSFGDAVYYSDYSSMRVLETKGSPINKTWFKRGNDTPLSFVDYLIANDTILGASLIVETQCIKQYIQMIANRIKYAEDFMFRIMMFDGISIAYYPHSVVMYEYGTGISTSKNLEWKKILSDDFEVSNDIILFRSPSDQLRCRFQKYLRKRNSKFHKLYKIFYFPQMVLCRLMMSFSKRCVSADYCADKVKWIEE